MTDDQKKEFQNQLTMQQIAQEKQKLMNERIVAKMDTVFFPKELITDRWREVTRKGIMNTIPVVSKTSVADFRSALKAVITPGGEITLNQFQVLANTLDTASPASFGMTEEEYIDAVDEVTATVEVWKKQLETLSEQITAEVEKEMSKKAGEKLKGNILQAVKAEA